MGESGDRQTVPKEQGERFEQQIEFLLELDRLKAVLRRSYLLTTLRPENSAEHSWHIACMALVLAEYADTPVDVSRVVAMLLLHDSVEIDAGDTYCYDTDGAQDKAQRERRAAERIFGLLPPDQTRWFREIWEEFEANQTPDARFANALDRLMPLLHNYHTGGTSWMEHGISSAQVRERMEPVRLGSERLWTYACSIIDKALAAGYLRPEA